MTADWRRVEMAPPLTGRPKGRGRAPGGLIVLLFLVAAATRPAQAWLWHEHRSIAATAIAELTPAQSQELAALWNSARAGRGERFCPELSAGDQGPTPTCLDFAAWTAIGGDHSCSFADLLETVSQSDWILRAAAVTARTAKELPEAKTPRRRDAVLTADTLGLAQVDPGFAARASGNNAHFMLARETSDGFDYIVSCFKAGAPPNTVGVYARNHLAALRLALALSAGGMAPEERADLARAILAREAFALHFLEDSFAAGHVAGCWGDAAERKGTHDYYNVNGLETTTWAGKNAILLGDGFMRPEDLERAAAVVHDSLIQVLEAARPTPTAVQTAVSDIPLAEAQEAQPVDVCAISAFPEATTPIESYVPLFEVLLNTPMPGRGAGIASLPRSRAEIGPFFALVSGGRFAAVDGGFQQGLGGTKVDAELDLAVRGGVGLESLLGERGDGLIFVQAGLSVHREAAAESYFSEDSDQLNPTARSAYVLRMRAPFYLVPGDLLVAGPVLVFTAPETLKKMAIKGAEGGLIPWQRPILTRAGRFQFILGREIGLTFYGYLGTGSDRFIVPIATPPGEPTQTLEVEVRSVEWEFPILEYRAFRSFATRQSHSLVLQLGAGFDTPTWVRVFGAPNAPAPNLRTRYFAFLRLAFDVRRYP